MNVDNVQLLINFFSSINCTIIIKGAPPTVHYKACLDIEEKSCFVVADISKNRAAMNRAITTVVSLLLVALSPVECGK